MLDIRLPYFYNLPVAVLLALYVINKLEGVFIAGSSWNLNRTINWAGLDLQSVLYLKVLLISLPALTAAAWFFRQFYLRNDLYVREAISILSIVNVLSYKVDLISDDVYPVGKLILSSEAFRRDWHDGITTARLQEILSDLHHV